MFLCLIKNHAVKTKGESDVVSRPGCFTLKYPGSDGLVGCVGPRIGLDALSRETSVIALGMELLLPDVLFRTTVAELRQLRNT